MLSLFWRLFYYLFPQTINQRAKWLAAIAHFLHAIFISLRPSHSNFSLVRAGLFISPDGFGSALLSSVQFSSVHLLLWSPPVSGWSFSGLDSTPLWLHTKCRRVFRILPLLQQLWLFFCLAMNFALEFS